MGVSFNLEVFVSDKNVKNDHHHLVKRAGMEITNAQVQEYSTRAKQQPVQERDLELLQDEEVCVWKQVKSGQTLVKNMVPCFSAYPNMGSNTREDDHEDNKRNDFVSLGLKVEISRYQDVNEERDDLKTPTTPDRKIPEIPPCPPAPRKRKSHLLTKRKSFGHRIALDFSQEIESMFSTSFDEVDLCVTGKNKKLKLLAK